MDIGTIIGMVLGFGLIVGSIVMGSPFSAFVNAPGLMIVVGGTIAATFVCETLKNVIGSIKIAKGAFLNKASDATETIETIVKLSNIARREGVLALENQQVDDEFLAKGMRMAADGLTEEEITETLNAELVCMKRRHDRGQKMFRFMGGSAPAMGMIGTLIGLVQMLRSLDDPATIGPSMAVALLTTLYGSVIAFVICNPIAEKLQRRSGEEAANMTVVIEGIGSIVKGQNASVIKDKLQARLSPDERASDEKAA